MVLVKDVGRTIDSLLDTFSPPRRYARTPEELDAEDDAIRQRLEDQRQTLAEASGNRNRWPQITEAEIRGLARSAQRGQHRDMTNAASSGGLNGKRLRRR